MSEGTLKRVGIVIRFLCAPMITRTKPWTPLPGHTLPPAARPPVRNLLALPPPPLQRPLPRPCRFGGLPPRLDGTLLAASWPSASSSEAAGGVWESVKVLLECDFFFFFSLTGFPLPFYLAVCHLVAILECGAAGVLVPRPASCERKK